MFYDSTIISLDDFNKYKKQESTLQSILNITGMSTLDSALDIINKLLLNRNVRLIRDEIHTTKLLENMYSISVPKLVTTDEILNKYSTVLLDSYCINLSKALEESNAKLKKEYEKKYEKICSNGTLFQRLYYLFTGRLK